MLYCGDDGFCLVPRGSISLLGDARVAKLADTSQMQHALVIVC